MNAADRAAFGRVEDAVRLTRYGGDCYSYCMLAAGHLDLVIETELKPYDIAALIPIITGAGGIVTTWDGKPAQDGGRIIAAGDPRVHEAAIKLLNGRAEALVQFTVGERHRNAELDPVTLPRAASAQIFHQLLGRPRQCLEAAGADRELAVGPGIADPVITDRH